MHAAYQNSEYYKIKLCNILFLDVFNIIGKAQTSRLWNCVIQTNILKENIILCVQSSRAWKTKLLTVLFIKNFIKKNYSLLNRLYLLVLYYKFKQNIIA